MQSRLYGPRLHQSFPILGGALRVTLSFQHRRSRPLRWPEMRRQTPAFHDNRNGNTASTRCIVAALTAALFLVRLAPSCK